MKNITSLRNHLFDTLNRLADATEQDIDLEVNKSIHIVNVAEAIIKTAEVENQFIGLTQAVGSGFIPIIENPSPTKGIGASQTEEETYVPKMFDVDNEKNWLIDSGETLSQNGNQPTHSINTKID